MNDHQIRAQLRGTHVEAALLAVHEEGGEAAHSAVIEAVGGDQFAGSEATATLQRLGLASKHHSMAHETTLTPQGRRVAGAIQKSRRIGPDRWDAVERAIITDLLEVGTRDASDWGIHSVDGQDINDHERVNAMQRLFDWGYLKGFSVAEEDGFVRIDPTARAVEVPGLDGLLAEHQAGLSEPSYSYSNSTTFGDNNTVGAVQTGGPANTQQVVQSITPDQRTQVLQLVGDLLRTLDNADPDATSLRAAVDEIRAEAKSDSATAGTIQAKVTAALLAAAASEAGHLITHGLAQLLMMLTG